MSETESGLLGTKRVQRPLVRQNSSCSNRQHHSSVIHKQGGRHVVGLTECPSVENPDLVFQETGDSQSQTHSRLGECGCRQAIQVRPDPPNRVVCRSSGLPVHMQQVTPAPDRPIHHKVQQQVTSVCVTSSRSPGLGSGRSQPVIGGSGCICLPTSSNLGQSGGKAAGPPLPQNHSDRSRVAKHDLVLGSSGHVKPDPPKSAQPTNTALQSDSSQASAQSKPLCLAPRTSDIKEQSFSEAVVA